ncbi:hypothetical protein C0J52_25554 [Blattella germanica]|nr:hypothetical protein C0J52_25554 [Blattella germanica]
MSCTILTFFRFQKSSHDQGKTEALQHEILSICPKSAFGTGCQEDSKPDWLYEKSPLGKVPALELENGDTLYESLIIADYLDEKYPQKSLYPKDPLKKAKDKLMIEQFNKVISSLYKLYQNMDRDYLDRIMKELDVFEREIASRGKAFFGGDKPGMLDYMIWPWCERSEMLKVMGGDDFVLPRNRFLRLASISFIMEWRNAMKEEESVQVSYLEPEIHAKYVNSHRAGYADYDMLVNCRKRASSDGSDEKVDRGESSCKAAKINSKQEENCNNKSQTKKAGTLKEEEEDPQCLYCGRFFSKDKKGQIWIRCVKCKGWNHEDCADATKIKRFVCRTCNI